MPSMKYNFIFQNEIKNSCIFLQKICQMRRTALILKWLWFLSHCRSCRGTSQTWLPKMRISQADILMKTPVGLIQHNKQAYHSAHTIWRSFGTELYITQRQAILQTNSLIIPPLSSHAACLSLTIYLILINIHESENYSLALDDCPGRNELINR